MTRQFNVKDHYAALGLKADATSQDINNAFSREIQCWSDSFGDQDAKKRLDAAVAAYDVLSDEKKRKIYDQEQEWEREDMEMKEILAARQQKLAEMEKTVAQHEADCAAAEHTMKIANRRGLLVPIIAGSVLLATFATSAWEMITKDQDKEQKNQTHNSVLKKDSVDTAKNAAFYGPR